MSVRRLVSGVSAALILTGVSWCFAQQSVPAGDAGEQIAGTLQAFVDRSELAGAVVLVADRERVLTCQTVGFADVNARQPMSEDSMFWIASQTKPITAAAVMILVDEGRLSLDDPVEKYLPEFQNSWLLTEKNDQQLVLRRPGHPLTIRETLNHTSGLPLRSELEVPTLDGLPLSTAAHSYAMTPLQSEPGTRYQYLNAGINTAARVLEAVSGQSYESFLQQRLLDPLKMNHTTFWPSKQQALRIARSYKPNAGGTGLEEFRIPQLIAPLTDRTQRYTMPAGGLFSTAQDVAQFCRMILNRGELDGQRILSEQAVSELTRRQTPADMQDSYGLGFAVGPDWFGHGGAQATNMEIRPDDGLVLIWMVQHAGYPGQGSQAQPAFRDQALQLFRK